MNLYENKIPKFGEPVDTELGAIQRSVALRIRAILRQESS